MLPYRIKNKYFPRLALGLVGRQFKAVLPMFGHVRWAGESIGLKHETRRTETCSQQTKEKGC